MYNALWDKVCEKHLLGVVHPCFTPWLLVTGALFYIFAFGGGNILVRGGSHDLSLESLLHYGLRCRVDRGQVSQCDSCVADGVRQTA